MGLFTGTTHETFRIIGDFMEEDMRPVKIVAMKTQMGQERKAAELIASRVNPTKLKILSIIQPIKIRGYIFLEVEDIDYDESGNLVGVDENGNPVGRMFIEMKKMIEGVRFIRGIVEKETNFSEIENFLQPKPVVIGIEVGDIVELISGPFKNEKGRVKHIDSTKEEITVELLESIVPIPVKVRGDTVRVIQKED